MSHFAAARLLPALLLLLAGCGGSTGGSKPAPAAGAVLRVPQTAEPTTLDPAQVEDGPTIEVLMHVFEGLVQWTPENTLAPALAEKWDLVDGGRTYVFRIRPGVRFHNGREVTAQDFLYSLTRSLDPATRSPGAMVYLNDVVGAREFRDGRASSVRGLAAPDDRTFRITIDRPKTYFLAKLTYPTAYAVCREAIESAGGEVTERSMVGTGPFRLQEYRRGDRILFEANPEYHEGPPRLARVERRILLDGGTRHDKFEAGELDLTDISMPVYRADRSNPRLSPLIRMFERASVFYLALNQQAFPPFRDPRVRRAFAHAVDRREIVRLVHEDVPRRAEGILPFGVPGHNPEFRGYPYDPARARRLLAEAGYPDGRGFPPITLSFRASIDDIRNTATAVQEHLKRNLGIEVRLDETEWSTFLKRRGTGEMPFYFLRWMADYLDPQNFLSTMLRTGAPENTLGYSNPLFDRLCDQADGMPDGELRLAVYRRAERIAVDDAPWIPIYYERGVELHNPKLRGLEYGLMGHLPHKRTHFAE